MAATHKQVHIFTNNDNGKQKPIAQVTNDKLKTPTGKDILKIHARND